MLFLLLWAASRWFWIDYDGGSPSMWEYGYFVTDEGYYTGGGKEKILSGHFVNAETYESCTWHLSPGMHVLAWLSFKAFGLTTWAHRVPFLLIGMGAWLVLYAYVSRRTLPFLAFLLCSCAAFNPYTTVYERTASTDVVLAAILTVCYCIGRGPTKGHCLAAGAILGLGIWIKLSVFALLPLALSSVLTPARTRDRFVRGGLFLLAFAASVAAGKALAWGLLYPAAVAQGTTVAHLNTISHNAYGLPNVFDYRVLMRGISSFPRYPTHALLGVWVPLLVALPTALFLWRIFRRHGTFDHRLLLYASIPAFAAAICIMNTYYAHYFLPVMMMLPVFWLEARQDLRRAAPRPASPPGEGGEFPGSGAPLPRGKKPSPSSAMRRDAAERPRQRRVWGSGVRSATGAIRACLCAAMATAVVHALFASYAVPPAKADTLRPYLSMAFNLPQDILWNVTGGRILLGTLAVCGCALLASLTRPRVWPTLGLALATLVAMVLSFSSLPMAAAARYAGFSEESLRMSALLSQCVSVTGIVGIWGARRTCSRGRVWYPALLLIFVAGAALNPVWRAGYRDIWQRTQHHNLAARKIAELVPPHAVVVGERAPQVLISLPIQVIAAPNENPVARILALHTQEPTRPLYALLDSAHAYHGRHYQENADKFQCHLVEKLRLPGFAASGLSDVYLLRFVFPAP